jgi:hypothetical protein
VFQLLVRFPITSSRYRIDRQCILGAKRIDPWVDPASDDGAGRSN